MKAKGTLATVSRVDADGPSFEAGVHADDVIVALNGVRLPAGDLDDRLESIEQGESVRLTLLRRDVLRTIDVPVVWRDDTDLSLERVDDPTDVQRRVYESWLDEKWPDDVAEEPSE